MARLLSAQRLAAIARRWEENMDARAIVLPAQIQDNGGGDWEKVYPAPTDSGLTSYACRLQSEAAVQEGVAAEQERGKAMWEVQLPVQSRVVPTDRLYVTGTDAKGGSYARLIEVTGPVGPRTWEAVRIVRGFEILPDPE